MKKNYKVITGYEFGDMYIDHFSTLKAAIAEYNNVITDGCDFCYLLETNASFAVSGNSYNKILSTYKRNSK